MGKVYEAGGVTPTSEQIAHVKFLMTGSIDAGLSFVAVPENHPEFNSWVGASITAIAQMKPATQEELETKLTVHLAVLDKLFYATLRSADGYGTRDAALKLETIETALKVQSSIRKTALAIDSIRNPRKPSTFIKNYVDRQLNQIVTASPQGQRGHSGAAASLPESEQQEINFDGEHTGREGDIEPEFVEARAAIETVS